MRTYLHKYDLPDNINAILYNNMSLLNTVAIDTETMGLNLHRDRLCLIQLTFDSQEVHFVHFPEADFSKSPNLKRMLENESVLKLFHFARFDLAILQYNFQIKIKNIYCTKVASHLVRTFTNKHGLKDLCKSLLGIEISKDEQVSDWGNPTLTENQLAYAANDVLYLHALKEILDNMLYRENRYHLAQASFNYLPIRAELDTLFGEHCDIMSHKLENR